MDERERRGFPAPLTRARHYIVPNAGPVTRVSFDLRICPRALRNYAAEKEDSRRGHRRPNFQEWRVVKREKDEPVTDEIREVRKRIELHYQHLKYNCDIQH